MLPSTGWITLKSAFSYSFCFYLLRVTITWKRATLCAKKRASIRSAHDQLAMLQPLDCCQLICQFSQSMRLTHDGHRMQATRAIQVILRRGKDYLLKFLLDQRDLRWDLSLSLIKKQHHRTCHNVVALPFPLCQVFLNQETDRLWPVGLPILQHILIQLLQQLILQRNSESLQCHSSFPFSGTNIMQQNHSYVLGKA